MHAWDRNKSQLIDDLKKTDTNSFWSFLVYQLARVQLICKYKAADLRPLISEWSSRSSVISTPCISLFQSEPCRIRSWLASCLSCWPRTPWRCSWPSSLSNIYMDWGLSFGEGTHAHTRINSRSLACYLASLFNSTEKSICSRYIYLSLCRQCIHACMIPIDIYTHETLN